MHRLELHRFAFQAFENFAEFEMSLKHTLRQQSSDTEDILQASLREAELKPLLYKKCHKSWFSRKHSLNLSQSPPFLLFAFLFLRTDNEEKGQRKQNNDNRRLGELRCSFLLSNPLGFGL